MQLSKYSSYITLKYCDYYIFSPKMEDSNVILLITRWAVRIHVTPSGTSFHWVKSSKFPLNWHWSIFQNGNLITAAIAGHLRYSYTQLTTLLQTSALIPEKRSHCINLSKNAILLTKGFPCQFNPFGMAIQSGTKE